MRSGSDWESASDVRAVLKPEPNWASVYSHAYHEATMVAIRRGYYIVWPYFPQ